MLFSVIIPTLQRPGIIRDTLESLAACDPQPSEVIIVDGDADRSARPVAEEILARHPHVKIRHHPSARGLTHQRNVGMAAATGDVVVFLDDDVEVDPSLFTVLAETYEDPAVVGATTKVVEPGAHRIGGTRSALRRLIPGGGREGGFTRFGYPRYLQDTERERDVEYMLGCMMSARLAVGRALGFDENMPGYAVAEDEDFSRRLSRRGRVRYVPRITTVHKKLGFGTRDVRLLNKRGVVNRVYLFRKNFRPTPLARIQLGAFLALQLAHRLANRDWQGARGFVEGVIAARDARPQLVAEPTAGSRPRWDPPKVP